MNLLDSFQATDRSQNAAFAKHLEDTFTSDTPAPPLSVDLYREIDNAIATHNAVAASRRADLDQQGTRLWNMALRVRNKVKDGEMLCLSGTALPQRSFHTTDCSSSRLCLSTS